jgi:hypothetical protein
MLPIRVLIEMLCHFHLVGTCMLGSVFMTRSGDGDRPSAIPLPGPLSTKRTDIFGRTDYHEQIRATCLS